MIVTGSPSKRGKRARVTALETHAPVLLRACSPVADDERTWPSGPTTNFTVTVPRVPSTAAQRWTASATSYAFLLFPLVAIALGAVLFEEPVQPSFLLGGAVVVAGVYVGAIYRPWAAAERAAETPAEPAN